MNSYDYNIYQLSCVATALGNLLPQVTFVGGSTTALLVDEAAIFGVRQTEDVDVVIDVTTYLDNHHFSEALRDRGFKEDDSGGPICRWLYTNELSTIKLDVIPSDSDSLGFSNRWYKGAIQTATNHELPDKTVIRLISAPYFLATKFEAFLDRGNGDYYSHDIEDILFVMEHRNQLIRELNDCDTNLKAYFATQASALLGNNNFLNILPGLLDNSSAEQSVTNSLKIMSNWHQPSEI